MARPLLSVYVVSIHLLRWPVRSQKSQRIDLNADYPCPCRRRGRIVPITLTEAFGCDRCQQIFVVKDDGDAIEQLATHYPYKRAWRWSGQQWVAARDALGQGYLPAFVVATFIVVLFVLLLATLQPPVGAGMVMRVVTALLVALLLVFMFWLACRR